MNEGGPIENSGVTATINFHADGAIFDGCWFLWDGPAPSYFTAYIDGPNNVVQNSHFSASGGYIYPNSPYMASYSGNVSFPDGDPLVLPD